MNLALVVGILKKMKPSRKVVLELLVSVGPMTAKEVRKFFEEQYQDGVSSVLSDLQVLKKAHVVSWAYETEGRRPVRVYKAGYGANRAAPVPKNNAERSKKYKQQKKVQPPKAPNSVFQLGSFV